MWDCDCLTIVSIIFQLILWWLVLSLEDTRVIGENHLPQVADSLYHIQLYREELASGIEEIRICRYLDFNNKLNKRN